MRTVPGDEQTTSGCRRSRLFRGRCREDTAHGRWPLIRHHEAGLSVPYRIGISGRRADSPPCQPVDLLYIGEGAPLCSADMCQLSNLKTDLGPARKWQLARWGLTEAAADALRKRTDPSLSYFILRPSCWGSEPTRSSFLSFLLQRLLLAAIWLWRFGTGKTKPKILLELYWHKNRVSIQF